MIHFVDLLCCSSLYEARVLFFIFFTVRAHRTSYFIMIPKCCFVTLVLLLVDLVLRIFVVFIFSYLLKLCHVCCMYCELVEKYSLRRFVIHFGRFVPFISL